MRRLIVAWQVAVHVRTDDDSTKPHSTLRNGPTNPWSKSNSPSLYQNQGDSPLRRLYHCRKDHRTSCLIDMAHAARPQAATAEQVAQFGTLPPGTSPARPSIAPDVRSGQTNWLRPAGREYLLPSANDANSDSLHVPVDHNTQVHVV